MGVPWRPIAAAVAVIAALLQIIGMSTPWYFQHVTLSTNTGISCDVDVTVSFRYVTGSCSGCDKLSKTCPYDSAAIDSNCASNSTCPTQNRTIVFNTAYALEIPSLILTVGSALAAIMLLIMPTFALTPVLARFKVGVALAVLALVLNIAAVAVFGANYTGAMNNDVKNCGNPCDSLWGSNTTNPNPGFTNAQSWGAGAGFDIVMAAIFLLAINVGLMFMAHQAYTTDSNTPGEFKPLRA